MALPLLRILGKVLFWRKMIAAFVGTVAFTNMVGKVLVGLRVYVMFKAVPLTALRAGVP